MKILATGASGFIGTNLVENYRNDGIDILNIDIAPPLNPDLKSCWEKTDIMDLDKMIRIFGDYQPTHIIHLVARTDCDENTTVEEDYTVNTKGTENVISAIKATPSVSRAIITSTQYVCGPDHFPENDEDYEPHTVYGQSKVITEQLTKNSDMSCIWTLIRPVNIWGPWHMRYRSEFWWVLRHRLYFHPGRHPVIRTYGYVGNVICQIRKIFESPGELVDRQTFYVGETPIDVYEWVNEFSMRMLGKPVRVVPRVFVRSLGWIGDVLALSGVKFPITSSRFRSMIQDYPAPMERTFKVLGKPQYTLKEGVEETVKWLEEWSDSGV